MSHTGGQFTALLDLPVLWWTIARSRFSANDKGLRQVGHVSLPSANHQVQAAGNGTPSGGRDSPGTSAKRVVMVTDS